MCIDKDKQEKDTDPTIGIASLSSVMKNIGLTPTDAEVADMIKEVSTYDSGTVTFEEFVKVMPKQHVLRPAKEEIRNTFKIFDKNGDQEIAKEDLKRVMEAMGERLDDDELDLMMKEADPSGSGKITFDQFKKAMYEAES